MNLNARMSSSRLKYMSQYKFLCNSANCTKARDAGCYLIAMPNVNESGHLVWFQYILSSATFLSI
jgi:hypothetical protein